MPLVVSTRGRQFLNLTSAARSFQQRVESYETAAAREATDVSRATFTRWLGHRPLAPPRPGRESTGGQFANLLEWKRSTNGMVTFDRATVEQAAPRYWLAQEIGTGESATILDTGQGVTVPSQRGRRLPMSLYWASGPGAAPSRPEAGRNDEQLYPIAMMPTGSTRPGSRTGRIRREIKGKHYIRDGGLAGFAMLRDELINDARRTFR